MEKWWRILLAHRMFEYRKAQSGRSEGHVGRLTGHHQWFFIAVDFSEVNSEHTKLDSHGVVHQTQAIQQLQSYYLWSYGQIRNNWSECKRYRRFWPLHELSVRSTECIRLMQAEEPFIAAAKRIWCRQCWPDHRRLMRIFSLWVCVLRTPAMQPHCPASFSLDTLDQSTVYICWVWITGLGLVHWASNPSSPRWDEDGSSTYWDDIPGLHACSIFLRANRSFC